MLSAIKKIIRSELPIIIIPIKSVTGFIKQQLSKLRVKSILNKRDEIFLELGAGEKRGQGKWVTIDMTRSCDLFWDLTKGIPFPNKTIQKIYASHFFEHFSYRETQKLLDECMRVLIPGGTISICVPNAKLYIEAYIEQRTLDEEQFFSGWKPAYNATTKIDYVNYVAYMDGHHKYMFDEENLVHILNTKGFINTRIRKFDPTLDRKARDHESIYAEGMKRKV